MKRITTAVTLVLLSFTVMAPAHATPLPASPPAAALGGFAVGTGDSVCIESVTTEFLSHTVVFTNNTTAGKIRITATSTCSTQAAITATTRAYGYDGNVRLGSNICKGSLTCSVDVTFAKGPKAITGLGIGDWTLSGPIGGAWIQPTPAFCSQTVSIAQVSCQASATLTG